MARKSTADSSSHHGLNDVVGLVLLGAAALLLVAMLSFDYRDIASNHVSTEPRPVSNWIGPIGAHLADKTFFIVGLTAYLLPFVLLFLGLGCFFERFAYLRRRWPWALLMVLAMMGILDLIGGWPVISHLRKSVNAAYAGGLIGHVLYQGLFKWCGMVGAAILYGLMYLISLLFLTNFQLGVWVRNG